MSGKYALVIGNTEYSDPGLSQLTAPGKDAENFAHVLKDPEIGGFNKVEILLNQPSYSVNEAIDEFFDQKNTDDLLVLYFSGHGIRDELGALYLAVKNTFRTRLRSTAVKSDYIRDVMDQSRSKRQVLILDCCMSGAFAQGTKAATGVSIGTSSAFEGGYGRIILTASDSTQFAWEGDKVIGGTDNSLFTHYLVEGLEGEADQDGDGRITVDELYDYAYEKVRFATPKQTPSKFSSKQQGEIILRQSIRTENIKPLPLSAELIDEIDDTRPYVREAAVQKLEKILSGKNIGLARSAKEALEKIAEDENTTRRVSQAATKVLESIRQLEEERRAREEEYLKALKSEEEHLARERAETVRLTEEENNRLVKQKAEEERSAEKKRLAEKKAEAERKAKEKAELLLAEQKVEEERLATEKVETERTAAEETKQLLAKQKAVEERTSKDKVEAKRIAEKKRRVTEKSEELVAYSVYVIVADGIPLYPSLPSSNNWSVWLKKGAKLTMTRPIVSMSSIGIFGHYIEVTDEEGNEGYVEANAVRMEQSPHQPLEEWVGQGVAQKITGPIPATEPEQKRQTEPLTSQTITAKATLIITIGVVTLLLIALIVWPQLVFMTSNSVSQEYALDGDPSVEMKVLDYNSNRLLLNGMLVETKIQTNSFSLNQPCQVIIYFTSSNNGLLMTSRSFTTMISPYISDNNEVSVYKNITPAYGNTLITAELFVPYSALSHSGLPDGISTINYYAKFFNRESGSVIAESRLYSFDYATK